MICALFITSNKWCTIMNTVLEEAVLLFGHRKQNISKAAEPWGQPPLPTKGNPVCVPSFSFPYSSSCCSPCVCIPNEDIVYFSDLDVIVYIPHWFLAFTASHPTFFFLVCWFLSLSFSTSLLCSIALYEFTKIFASIFAWIHSRCFPVLSYYQHYCEYSPHKYMKSIFHAVSIYLAGTFLGCC